MGRGFEPHPPHRKRDSEFADSCLKKCPRETAYAIVAYIEQMLARLFSEVKLSQEIVIFWRKNEF